MQVKELEPMVLWQTALGSQGEERHSSISVKYKRLWLQKLKITFTTIIKGLWGCPSYSSTKRIRGSLVRGADIIRSQRGNPLRSPLRKVLNAPPPEIHYDVSPLVPHLQDVFCPFVGGRILLQCSPVVGTGAVVGTANWIRCNKNPNVCRFSYHWNSSVYYVQPHIGFPVQFHHNNKSCRQDGRSVLLFQDYYCYDV